MKNSKLRRILLTLACAVLLVSLSVGATLAYLTSKTDPVVNTFSVGKVKIDLDEAPVDLYGKVVTGDRVKANEYKLLPGHEYAKDPTVHIDRLSEECYVFVTVENEIAELEIKDDPATTEVDESLNTIENQMLAKGWVKVTGYDNVWVYNTTVVGAVTPDLRVFDKFIIDGSHKESVLAAHAKQYDDDGNPIPNTGSEITIKAYAIQADGLKTYTSAQIWQMLNNQLAADAT